MQNDGAEVARGATSRRPAPGAVELSSADAPWDAELRYSRREVLGAGGMGEVALYKDGWIGREVALKKLHVERAAPGASRLRFLQEMQVQGQLEHPAIVPVHDCGIDPSGQRYFTMRRVRGPTLAEILDGLARGDAETTARYSRRKLLTAFVSVCLAVHYAHTRGVLHRDLKPSNVMLGEFGEVYVLDWGASKLVGGEAAEGSPAVTEEGAIVGTPAYMAPEQLLGEPARDARADVYALGMILFELLALRPIHGGRDTSEIIETTVRGLDNRPSIAAADVAPELDAICVRATARRSAERFAGAQEMADAIERYLDGDRDLERRRALSAEHAARAREASAREGEAGRAEAMREVVKALAFDPEQADATRTLVELMVTVPETMPVEAEAEMQEAVDRSRVETAKLAFLASLGWLAFTPVGPLVGVRSWPAYLLTISVAVLTSLYSLWMWRAKAVAPRYNYGLALIIAVAVASMSAWLGPLVLVPMCAAVVTLLVVTSAMRAERAVMILIGALIFLVPLALEVLHVLPPSFAFEGGRMVILPRGYDLPAGITVGGLVYAGVTWIVIPPLLLGRVRDTLSRAERELFLRAWHFRRLLPDGPMTVVPPAAR